MRDEGPLHTQAILVDHCPDFEREAEKSGLRFGKVWLFGNLVKGSVHLTADNGLRLIEGRLSLLFCGLQLFFC